MSTSGLGLVARFDLVRGVSIVFGDEEEVGDCSWYSVLQRTRVSTVRDPVPISAWCRHTVVAGCCDSHLLVHPLEHRDGLEMDLPRMKFRRVHVLPPTVL